VNNTGGVAVFGNQMLRKMCGAKNVEVRGRLIKTAKRGA